MEYIVAPIDHLSNDHKYCGSSWYHKGENEEEPDRCIKFESEKSKEGHQRFNKEDGELYLSLCELYEPYITEDRI